MNSLNYSELTVNSKIAVARPGSWTTHSEGVYTVVKVDKVKVVVSRVGDGHTRTFSVKRRCELPANSFRNAYLETVEEQEARNLRLAAEQALRRLWEMGEQGARNKDLTALKAVVAELTARLDAIAAKETK